MMKMTGPKEEINSTFFLAFMGQRIIITIDLMASIISSSEAGTITEMVPIFYEGILLDEDSEYFYLGPINDPNQIIEAVPKSRRVHIKISDDDEVTKEFLKQVPIEGEMN
jgi:hypothetical protein